MTDLSSMSLDCAFRIAVATRPDNLQRIAECVDEALREGKTFEEFRAAIARLLAILADPERDHG